MAFLGELLVKITGQTSQFDQSIDKSQAKLQNFQNKATAMGRSLTATVTLPVLGLAAAFTKSAVDAEETASKFKQVFREVERDADKVAKNLSKNFGLSSKNAKKLLGDTGDLLTGFGFTSKAALNMSKQVNELAVDLASFTNYSGGAEGASRALTKALLGEREQVKMLGIAITEAEIKRLAEDKGITGTLDRQTKAMLTLELAARQSKNAIGDFARTQDSAANQMRTLMQDVDDLAVSFGEILLPLVKDIVSGLRDAVKWFTDADEETKNLIITIGGLAAAIGPVLLIMPKLIGAFYALGGAISANPIGAAVVALSALAIVIGTVVSAATKESKNLNRISNELLDTQTDINTIRDKLADTTDTLTRAEKRNLEVQKEQLELKAREKAIELSVQYGKILNEIHESEKRQAEIPVNALRAAGELSTAYTNQKAIREEVQTAIDKEIDLQTELNDKIADTVDTLARRVAADQMDLQLLQEIDPQLAIQVGLRAALIEKENEHTDAINSRAEAYLGTVGEMEDAMAREAGNSADLFKIRQGIWKKEAEEFKDKEEKKREEAIKTAAMIISSVGGIVEATVTAAATEADAWEAFKQASLNAIASLVRALAEYMVVQAAKDYASLNIPGGIAWTAGAAAAYAAAALIPNLEHGGLVMPQQGGTVVRMAEAGSPEYAIPETTTVMNRLADRIVEGMSRPNVTNNVTNNEMASDMTVNIGGEEFYGFLTKASRDGKFLIDPNRGVSKR